MIISPRLWLLRALYFALGLLCIAYPLLPLQFTPDRFTAPDLIYVLTVAWVIRAPESAPFVLIAGLALLSDAVLMRPVGLWAMLLLGASEVVRFSYMAVRERGILAEFALAAGLFVAMLIIQNFFLWLSFSQSLEFTSMVQFAMLTLLCYPAMVGFLNYIVRVRKPDHSNRPDRLGKIK